MIIHLFLLFADNIPLLLEYLTDDDDEAGLIQA